MLEIEDRMLAFLGPVFFFYFLLGAFSGITSGLLGVGGGIIIVPVLLALFQWQGFPMAIGMHMAVGTSLAIMLVTTIIAFLSHRRYRMYAIWPAFPYFLLGVAGGALCGARLTYYLNSRLMAVVFGFFLLFMAFYMLFSDKVPIHGRLPNRWVTFLVGSVSGSFSGLLGIGGSTLTIPFLVYCRVSIRDVILIAILTSMVAALVGTSTMIVSGYHNVHTELLVGSTGYVYWPAFVGVVLGGVVCVPLGVRLSYHLSKDVLKRLFVVFLLLMSVYLLWSYF